ncbi:MAG: HAD-IA family hydrolase [Planctomycetota bacterium]|jgi:putative hydrolase of the HAD superfamily|nr:HAD-IA family hydrolase [Planctomycetota bacterium]
MKELRAFFFDLDDTIYSITDFADMARRSAIKAMIAAGLRIAPDDCYRELQAVIAEFGSNHEQHFDKLLKRLPSATHAHKDPRIICAAGVAAYHDAKPYNFFPFNDAMEVLRQLQAQRLPLGIITSGIVAKQAEKIVRLGLHQMIDHRLIFITDGVGISKNNPRLYETACRAVNAPPETCAYIGDNPPVDVDVPAQIGMLTFLCRRGGKYRLTTGKTEPTYKVDNFFDVLEIINRHYEIIPA